MDVIYRRRSIRSFRAEALSEDQLFTCIKAGMNAPSAGNEQPWQFLIINQRSLLDEIPKFHPHSKMLKEAPAAILVCGDLSLRKYEEYWIQDCAAATQNILLTITDLGLGGVWLGIYPRKDRVSKMKSLVNLPDHVVPFSLIAVGYPAEEKPPKNIFDRNRIHFNTW